MRPSIPYKKIIRLALITTLLFGLFGSIPALQFGKPEFTRIRAAFFIICGITLILWIINTVLLWALQKVTFNSYNWFRYLLSIVFAVILASLIFSFALATQLRPPHFNRLPEFEAGMPKPRFIFPLIQILAMNIFIIVLIEMILLRNTKMQIENENTLLRMANLEAKHSQLKQQLQPHFLFNSLSVLKSLIKRFPDQAEDYLEKLSEFLRFSIDVNKQTIIPLKEELELVTNYLHMQQVRFGNALYFTITIPPSVQLKGSVPVYSIQLLAENAIKHNTLTKASPLHIFIASGIEKKTITVSNNLQPKSIMEETNGVGLANLSGRYKLLGNYDIAITQTANEFMVAINIIEL